MEQKTKLAHGFDIAAIRRAAANLDEGAVTEGYQADREAVIAMLNDALATELLCVLRYKRHYYTVSGPNTGHIKAEFLEHAQQEQDHADRIAERVAIESYRQMIAAIGDKDPTTVKMLTDIMAVEEEHADDMRDLLS